MKLTNLPLAAVVFGSAVAQLVPDPEWLAELAFPDLGWELYSSPFTTGPDNLPGWQNGTASPVSQATLLAYLKNFTEAHSYATYDEIPGTTLDGNVIPVVFLTNGASEDKVRVWLQGGAHGNEPAGDGALLELLAQWAVHPVRIDYLLETMDIMLLPRYNPDGVDRFQRYLANGIDPNRDHVILNQEQTRNIKKYFNQFSPHVILDMHEYGPRRQGGGQYSLPTDALIAAAKNLNIDSGIRILSESLYTSRLREELEKGGFAVEAYPTIGQNTSARMLWDEASSRGKIGRNSHGLTQAISFLTETRGIGLADAYFSRRVAAGLTMANAILNATRENSAQVLAVIEAGISKFIEDSRTGRSEIVVTDYPVKGTKSISMADFATNTVHDVEVDWTFTTPYIANLTRLRPYAYGIDVNYSELLRPRLEALGLSLDTLDSSWEGEVEALKILDSTASTTSAETIEIVLDPGALILKTDQKNAGLAFAALEPESVDSFVFEKVFNVTVGEYYPIYRVMSLDAFGTSK